MSDRARYVMVGGFLGAGKTTAIARFAKRLADAGTRVGLITNDQSTGLVDTALLKSRGFAVEEIAGGCFCCRFDSLNDAAARLTESTRPDVILAEPVGSCTDLVATVSYPLRRIYGERFSIAPLSVMVDPRRAARVLGLPFARGRAFSPKVVYVYEKQLEEAQLIVVNKCDQIEGAAREELVAALEARFPRADVLCCSSTEGDGLDGWFDRILREEQRAGDAMQLDYRTYAEGEALLGWLNLSAELRAESDVDANALLLELTEDLRRMLDERGVEIAHLKATLDAPEAGGQLAAVSLTTGFDRPDLREALVGGVRSGSLILNLRAEADPELLHELAIAALRAREASGITLEVEHEERFRPAPPTPTHRIETLEAGAR